MKLLGRCELRHSPASGADELYFISPSICLCGTDRDSFALFGETNVITSSTQSPSGLKHEGDLDIMDCVPDVGPLSCGYGLFRCKHISLIMKLVIKSFNNL